MAKQPKPILQRIQLPLPLLITIIVVAIGIVAWTAFSQFRPVETGSASEEDAQFIARMAMKSGGDVNALDASERQKLDRITGGHSEQALRMHPSAAMNKTPANMSTY